MTLGIAGIVSPIIADSFSPFFIMMVIQWGLLVSAISFSYAAYSRLCSTMFAICYVAQDKATADPNSPSGKSSQGH
jgi:hypothetical protein